MCYDNKQNLHTLVQTCLQFVKKNNIILRKVKSFKHKSKYKKLYYKYKENYKDSSKNISEKHHHFYLYIFKRIISISSH